MKIPFPFVFSWNLINIAVHKLVDTAVNICNDFPGITVPLQKKDKLIKTAKRMEREDAMEHSVEENYYWKPSVYLQKTTPETKLSPQVFVWPVSRLVEISSSPLSELKLPFFYNHWRARQLNAVRKKLNEGEQISIFVPRCLWLCPPKNSKVQFSQWEALLSFLLVDHSEKKSQPALLSLELAQGARKTARTRCYWFWSSISLVEKLARDFHPITKRSNCNRLITFDSHLKPLHNNNNK